MISQNNNSYYISQINELKKQLNDERIQNHNLINENNILKNQINNLKKDYNIKISNYKIQIKSLQDEIVNKNNEILNYQSLINNNQFNSQIKNSMNYSITSIKPGEKIMAINFVSMGNQDIGHYAIACKNTDLFIRLEEKLYNDFPQLKEHDLFFEVNTRRIKRFKTLDENNIKNNNIINIFIIDP